MRIKPRDYQEVAVNKTIESFQSGIQRQLIVMATGTGKTFTMAFLHKKLMSDQPMMFVVDRIELAKQTKESFKKLFPEKRIEIEMGTRYASKDVDILILSIDTWGRKGTKRILKYDPDYFKTVALDEAHTSPTERYDRVLNYFGVGHENLKDDRLLIGLSVGPESYLELKGGIFGDGWFGTIEDAWEKIDELYITNTLNKWDEIKLWNVYSRGWEDGKFVWKKVKKFIRHDCTKDCMSITTGGTDITLTNDHSIYTVTDSPNNKLHNILTKNLTKKDIALYDTGFDNSGDTIIDVPSLLHELNLKTKILVQVNLSNISHKTFKQYNIEYKKKWEYKNTGKHGHYLPLDKFIEMKEILPEPNKIYHVSASGTWINPKIKYSDWAYFIGFFYGDGWFDKYRIGFAIENKRVSEFKKVIEELSNVTVNYSITQKSKGSVEFRISNIIFVQLLKHFLKDEPCHKKIIQNDIIFKWNWEQRYNFLAGLIDSDGHLQIRSRNRKSYRYVTTSKKLAYSLHAFLRSLNIQASVLKRNTTKNGGIIDGRQIINKHQSYLVSWSYYSTIKNHSGRKGHRTKLNHRNWIFNEAPIRKIKTVNKPKFVYDLEMEGHPSFVANGILVHNTATPNRPDGVGLKKVFDDITCNYDLIWGIKNGWLTEIVWHPVDTGINLNDVKSNRNEFQQKDLSITVDVSSRNEQIVKAYHEYSAGKRSIAFCASVEHAYNLAALFRAYGVEAETISAQTKDDNRAKYMKAFHDGDIKVLTNFGTLVVGIDETELDSILQARPVKSDLLYRQMIGRGIRPSRTALIDIANGLEQRKRAISNSRKPYCKVIDFVDSYNQHDIRSAPQLFGLHDEVQAQGKRMFEDVYEPLKEAELKHGIEIGEIKNLDEIELRVKQRQRISITSLEVPKDIKRMSKYSWISIGDEKWELSLYDANLALVVQVNTVDRYDIFKVDLETGQEEKVNSHGLASVQGALNVADQFAERNYNMKWTKHNERWRKYGVTEKQFNQIVKNFQPEIERGILEIDETSTYKDTDMPFILYHYTDTPQLLKRGTCKELLGNFYTNMKKKRAKRSA